MRSKTPNVYFVAGLCVVTVSEIKIIFDEFVELSRRVSFPWVRVAHHKGSR